MSFIFRSFIGKSDSDASANSGSALVERLLHRIESVTLLADRREGLRSLKSVAKEHRLDIGAHGMDTLLKILDQDRADQELVAITLDILCLVMAESEDFDRGLIQPAGSLDDFQATKARENDSLGAQLSEIFLKKTESLSLVLDFSKEFQFQLRWPAVRLLCIMAQNASKALQEALLRVPGGITSLMDLLTDNREIIRNDALLLLIFITRNNSSLQKIVAFGKAFDTLLDIIRDEGASEGGVVVEDCLILISQLLAGNISNIKLFKEDGCISRLCSWFGPDASLSSAWPDQRKINACAMLQLIRTIVSPGLSQQTIKMCQDAIFKCGLFGHISAILMMPGVPLAVLVEALNTVAELVRGNKLIQDNLAAMEAPTKPPRPVLAILCVSMFNERQALELRLAVLYVLKSFLLKNEPMQATILDSVAQNGEAQQYTLGQLLCQGLFSDGAVNQWFSAISLLHCVLEDDKHKEMLLNVNLTPSAVHPATSIFEQSGQILKEVKDVQAKVGVLQLLAVWMADSPVIVAAFLRIPDITFTMVSQILETSVDPTYRLCQGLCSFLLGLCIYYNDDLKSRNELLDLVRNRITFDAYREKVTEITRHESFLRVAKGPDPALEKAEKVPLLDFDFIRYYKSMEGKIFETLDPSLNEGLNGHDGKKAGIFVKQKEALRERDERISMLESQVAFVTNRLSESNQRNEELERRLHSLELSVEQKSADLRNLQDELAYYRPFASHHQAALEKLRLLDQDLFSWKSRFADVEMQLEQYKLAASETEQLRSIVNQQQEQLASYHSYYEQLQQGGDPNAALILEKADLATKTGHLESLLVSWQAEANRRKEQADELRAELDKIRTETEQQVSDTIQAEITKRETCENELEASKNAFEELNREHSDLLELLSDADAKLKSYRSRLRRYGETVSDDEDS